MPKLLIVNITANQGSTGKISEQVGMLMQERGWDVYLAHGARRVNPSRLNSIPFSNITTEYLHALKSLLFDADGLGSTRATKKLIDKIKEFKPDVIHLHNLHGYYLNFKLLFRYLNRTSIPVVMTLHDCWSFTGHCTHFVTANCEKWVTGCDNCPLSAVYPKRSLFLDKSRRNYNLKDKYLGNSPNLYIVAVSEWMAGNVKRSILKNHPISVCHNGIDLSTFQKHEKRNDGIFRILGVANVWYIDKGLNDIYELRKLLPLDKFRITLVGLSKKQVEQLPAGIDGITRISNQAELAKLYSDSDVLINPTYADTFPTINLEALACGTPVITYKTGGSPEAIDLKTGVVVELGDVVSMANSIKAMREAPLLSSDCRKRAELLFDKNKCFEKYVSLFEKLTLK